MFESEYSAGETVKVQGRRGVVYLRGQARNGQSWWGLWKRGSGKEYREDMIPVTDDAIVQLIETKGH